MPEQASTKTITFLVDSKLKNVSLAGVAIRGICGYLSLSEVDAYYLELCVVEAVNNAITHAYDGKEGHAVEVNITYSTEEIVLNITDRGKKMSLYHPRFLEFNPEDLKTLPEHGLGLYIINSVMDEVIYTSEGGKNTLTMRKNLYST
ncbi:MAG: ATP-binding protein [Syntrophorhabdaceae bacterium]|nr:ATP-binding protein [Syntrophorhabdaceae bacterium]